MNDDQLKQLLRLKAYFPYRIIFGVIDKESGEFSTYAKTTKHIMNRLVREGHKVYKLSN